MSVQCRTMLSQRPCGSSQCTREECSRARESASVFETIPDTETDVTGSESAPQGEGVSVSMPSLERLTAAHVRALMAAVDRDAVTNKQPTTELREAFRILVHAHCDAHGK